MQIVKTISCFMLMSIIIQHLHAQSDTKGTESGQKLLFNVIEFIQTDSGLIINYYNKSNCKSYWIRSNITRDTVNMPLQYKAVVSKEPVTPKFITIHGNVSYDFFYRSKIDTPFSQQNLQQHTERVWLDVLIKEKYPFKIGFTARQSNSPFFRDLYSMNMNFNRYGYIKNTKQELLNRLSQFKWQDPHLKIIDTALQLQLKQYGILKNYINGPEALQRIIEEREKFYLSKQKKVNMQDDSNTTMIPVYHKIKLSNGQVITVKTDSIVALNKDMDLPGFDSSFIAGYLNKQKELDSLKQSIAELQYQSDSLKNAITQNISTVKQAIYKAKNPKELAVIAKENGISQPREEKLEKFLLGVKSLGIGRSMVDYTELTAQSIMLTGVNVEYNPSYYAAFAAGKIDYGFRDFFGRGIKQKNQYLVLGRTGWGDKDKRTFIITVFNGQKSSYAGVLAADSGNITSRIFGYSVEAIFRKNENTFFSAEVAKSTKARSNASSVAGNKPDNLFKYNDDSNMGFNIKGATTIPETDTKLSGFYRKTGEQFQSFSLFTYNTNQQSWQLRADQSFSKRKVNLTAMLRQNDFTNPLTNKTFKTTTVFKSLQVNMRLPHWPVINAGYYPGSQFYIIDNNTVRENAYYILNGSVLYAYKLKDIAMNSTVIYNRYFNKATDSGFVLYKGINYIISQTLTLPEFQMEGSYSYNKQAVLKYYTLDANGDYSLRKFLRIGGGVKYNHVLSGKDYWGQSVRITADFKKMGGLQLHYEKSFLPTIQQTLYPVEIGRVSWYKIF